MAQSPAIPWSHSTERTRPAAYGDAAVEQNSGECAARCQHRQQKEPQATQRMQPSVHQGPRQSFGPSLNIDAPQHPTAGPGTSVIRNLFGESPSRAQLNGLFSKEQQQVCEHDLCPLLGSYNVLFKLKLLLAVQSERQFKDKWNFDVAKEVPVSGRWRYDPASQQ